MDMKAFFIVIIIVSTSVAAFAQEEEANRRRNFNLVNGVALNEFDPVSYFKKKPAKGNAKFSYDYKGITYYFSSDANLQEFKKSPAKYEPAYGGWCAYSLGVDGQRVKIDASTYKVIEGKVYLFSNFNGNNTLLKWNKSEKNLKSSADYYWRKTMH